MVCVDGDPYGTSIQYKIEFGLSGLQMGFCAERKDFPPFPAQLGCQGLIVFDAEGKIIVSRSPSLNQVGPRAFKNVDSVLATLIEDECEDWENSDEKSRVYENIDDLRNDVRMLQANAAERASKMSQIGRSAKEKGNSSSSVSTTCLPPEERYQQRLHEQNEKNSQHNREKHSESCSLVPSVGHIEMDEEHDACSSSLMLLESEQSVEALQKVVKLLSSHFDHEAEMLRQAGFGKMSAMGLSPLDSHIADHNKIIHYANTELQKAVTTGGKLSADCSKTLINHFVRHANDFDSRYEDFLKIKNGKVVP